jgi:hypothetical protein
MRNLKEGARPLVSLLFLTLEALIIIPRLHTNAVFPPKITLVRDL